MGRKLIEIETEPEGGEIVIFISKYTVRKSGKLKKTLTKR